MSADPQTETRAADEAAQWFARLNAVTISTVELGEFRVWRRAPANDAAYAALERLWRRSSELGADPEIQAALLGAQKRNMRLLGPGHLSLAVGGGLSAVAAGVAAVLILAPTWSAGRIYETKIGEARVVALDDGSHVHLDTDTRLRVQLSDRERVVVLERGQALFDVVHRADRPFRVKVGDTLIQDLGTRFDVRRDAGQVRITVVEGLVQVGAAAAKAAWTVSAGQQMTAGSSVTAPHAVDPLKTTAWTSGRLIFQDLPLSAATAEINRYGRPKVILQAAGVADIKVNGAFDSTDTQAFVAAVSRLYDLQVETQPDGSIILTRASPAPAGLRNKSDVASGSRP